MALINKATTAIGEASRFAKSKKIGTAISAAVAAGTDAVLALNVPRKGFIKDIWVEVITAYTALSTGNMQLGVTGDKTTDQPYAFLDTDDLDLTTTGMKRVPVEHSSYYFEDGPGGIIATFDKNDSAADVEVRIFVEYDMVW